METMNEINEEHWQKVNYNIGCYERRFANGCNNYRNMELEKQRAYILRNKSLMNIEKLLVDFETHFNEHGGNVLWARDADDAKDLIWEIVNDRDINGVVRSNSVALDEIGLDAFLEEKKIPVYESSISRYILKTLGQAPYHPVYPTIHLSKEEINGVLNERFKLKLDSSTKQIANFIRHQVRQDLMKAQVCITGANFLLSDIGGVVMTENEGNILKSSTLTKIHIVVVGFDKVIPNTEDLSILLPLLSAHATGHGMSSVSSITLGPSRNGDGTDQMYVIILDNGRSELLKNEVIRQALSCIHCGACISVCPIYKNMGGYAYEGVFMGPIGTAMSPLMLGMKEYQHLSTLCSLCGRCSEVCPVKIPIEDLIIENRRMVTTERIGDAKYEMLVRSLIGHCKSRKKMDCPQWLKKLEYKQLVDKKNFTIRKMPELAPKSFSQKSEERSKK